MALVYQNPYKQDLKSAKKNLAELNKILFAGDPVKLEQFFVRKPAADWLNYIFLEESELNEVIANMKAVSSECRTIIAAAIEKELTRLVNYKTLFEKVILNKLQ
jgi:3-methyladenine DNA glycosylase AlkC